jgi:DNA polymerase-3 subunit epsilon
MFYKLLGKDYLRRHLLSRTNSEVMKHYLSAPFPEKRALLRDTEIISLDIETTGLDPDKDRIVSIGMVKIESLGIKLDSCWHKIINAKINLPEQSVVIHQIMDDESLAGASIGKVIPELLQQLKGKVVLVHNANVEQGFINKACQNLYGTDFVMSVIDTQVLAKRSLERTNMPYKAKDLRLFNLRKSFNLPVYKAHNALLDAIATAELFLLLANNISPKSNAKLSEFLT